MAALAETKVPQPSAGLKRPNPGITLRWPPPPGRQRVPASLVGWLFAVTSLDLQLFVGRRGSEVAMELLGLHIRHSWGQGRAPCVCLEFPTAGVWEDSEGQGDPWAGVGDSPGSLGQAVKAKFKALRLLSSGQGRTAWPEEPRPRCGFGSERARAARSTVLYSIRAGRCDFLWDCVFQAGNNFQSTQMFRRGVCPSWFPSQPQGWVGAAFNVQICYLSPNELVGNAELTWKTAPYDRSPLESHDHGFTHGR